MELNIKYIKGPIGIMHLVAVVLSFLAMILSAFGCTDSLYVSWNVGSSQCDNLAGGAQDVNCYVPSLLLQIGSALFGLTWLALVISFLLIFLRFDLQTLSNNWKNWFVLGFLITSIVVAVGAVICFSHGLPLTLAESSECAKSKYPTDIDREVCHSTFTRGFKAHLFLAAGVIGDICSILLGVLNCLLKRGQNTDAARAPPSLLAINQPSVREATPSSAGVENTQAESNMEQPTA